MGPNLGVLLLRKITYSDLGFVGTGVIMKEKGLSQAGANGWALLTYWFYHSR